MPGLLKKGHLNPSKLVLSANSPELDLPASL